MPELHDISKDVARITRDATYVAVGLGVLGFQRAQVQRQALQRKLRTGELDDTIGELRAGLTKGVRQVDDLVGQALDQFDASVEPLEQQLPAVVREVVGQAHSRVREVRSQIHEVVRSVD